MGKRTSTRRGKLRAYLQAMTAKRSRLSAHCRSQTTYPTHPRHISRRSYTPHKASVGNKRRVTNLENIEAYGARVEIDVRVEAGSVELDLGWHVGVIRREVDGDAEDKVGVDLVKGDRVDERGSGERGMD